MYVHCSDVYVHVYTSKYALWLICTNHVQTCTYKSVPYFLFTYMYVKVCTADVSCTNGYIYFKKCTDIIELCTYIDASFYFSFLFCLAGWPVGRDWLLPGLTPTQVQAHLFNQHQPLVFLPPCSPAFLAWLGADSATAGAAAGSSQPEGEQPLQRQRGEQPLSRRGLCCDGAARVLDAGLVLGRCSSVLLVLESELEGGLMGDQQVTTFLLNHSKFIWKYLKFEFCIF